MASAAGSSAAGPTASAMACIRLELFDIRHAGRHLAAKHGLGRFHVARRGLKVVEKRCRGHLTRRDVGGREWESNPPKTGSRPLPDLKSGRPTGDDSLPLSGFGGC